MSKPKQLDAVSSFTRSLESQALDSDGTAAPRTYICLRIRREWGAYRAPLIEVVLVCRSSDLKDSAQGRCMSPSKEHSKLKRSGILSICDLHASKGRMKGLGTDRVRQNSTSLEASGGAASHQGGKHPGSSTCEAARRYVNDGGCILVRRAWNTRYYVKFLEYEEGRRFW